VKNKKTVSGSDDNLLPCKKAKEFQKNKKLLGEGVNHEKKGVRRIL
jgi:hypothetical protein